MRVTTKKQTLSILVIVLLLGCSAFYFACFQKSDEPSYKGKTLTWWLKRYDTSEDRTHVITLASSESIDAAEAIRAIGTNAVPTLLKLVSSRDGLGVRTANLIPDQFGWTTLHIFNAGDKHRLAAYGFLLLGEQAHSATPELEWLSTHGSSESRSAADQCLIFIGSDRYVLVPLLVRLINGSDPSMARYATNRLLSDYPSQARSAGIYKEPPTSKVPTTN